jgi:hypothetical protein
MSVTDLQTELDTINAAINTILTGGQEIQTRTGRVKLADLATLQAKKADLERQIAYQSGSIGGFVDVVYDNR